MIYRQAVRFLLVAILLGDAARADDAVLEDGLYEVHFRLELPHLETYATDQKTTVCIDQARLDRRELLLPLLSQNDIFDSCDTKNIRRDRTGFSYEILCAGRGAATATATYAHSSRAFIGRISIIQGAKNMTMTEIQRGRFIGRCEESQVN